MLVLTGPTSIIGTLLALVRIRRISTLTGIRAGRGSRPRGLTLGRGAFLLPTTSIDGSRVIARRGADLLRFCNSDGALVRHGMWTFPMSTTGEGGFLARILGRAWYSHSGGGAFPMSTTSSRGMFTPIPWSARALHRTGPLTTFTTRGGGLLTLIPSQSRTSHRPRRTSILVAHSGRAFQLGRTPGIKRCWEQHLRIRRGWSDTGGGRCSRRIGQ